MQFENGRQRHDFRDALLSAFPRRINLEEMLSFELNENLDQIATGESYSEVVFKLIQWAEAKGRLEELIKAACTYEPENENEQLKKFCQQYSPTQPPEKPTTSPPTEDDDELLSERGVDYTRLRDLLKAGEWKEADKETTTVMLKAAGREKEGLLNSDSIEKFPCTDLRTIDQLWIKYSNGRFGFSVQKRIWESENREILKYSKKVGYIKEEKGYGLTVWLGRGFYKYDELTFDLSAPSGHLPEFDVNVEKFGFVVLFSRLETCKI